ncbi:MFS transporter [Mycolicibacterium moriokaense]|nr:MFS transporter [Mycolicibacterium moriokaense]
MNPQRPFAAFEFVSALVRPGNRRVIALLALVVGLEGASTGAVGAVAMALKQAFQLDNVDIGLLVTVSTGIGIVATLAAGSLADRANRTRVLWITVLIWSVAMALSALSTGYRWLLVCRLALGVTVAVGGPAVASLMGDYFVPRDRGRIYGYVLAGEGICTATGILISGWLAAISWRLSFLWLAVAGALLALGVAKLMPEPIRGGRARFSVGQAQSHDSGRRGVVAREVLTRHVAPHPSLILRENPQRRSLWWVVRYVLSIKTNAVLIVASTCGYVFFTGLATFAVVLLRGRFGVPQAVAMPLVAVIGIGALIGSLSSGRIADSMARRGHLSARVTVAGTAFLIAGVFFLPVLLSASLAVAVVFAFLAAIGLGGVNPALDAVRLDIMHSRLWGRAEAVRTTLRTGFTAVAPLVFGFLSVRFSPESRDAQLATTGAIGLQRAFLVMLLLLFAAGGLVLLVARRTYPADVATAVISELVTGSPSDWDPRSDSTAGRIKAIDEQHH